MADVAIVARTSRPACRPAGVTGSWPAGRLTGRTACRAACRLAGSPGTLGRPAGVTVSRLSGRGSGSFGLAHPYPDLRSFGFGDEVIEEKAVLLLFKVEVVELNDE
jgi:hypothetical protein